MKITVGDVMSSNVNVRDYLSVHPENCRIYVNGKVMDKVLVDRTVEWDELKGENARLREALEEIKFQANLSETPNNVVDAVDQALKGESE